MFNTNAQCYKKYITSLADVSSHIVAYMYARFRYSGKNPMRFAVFWTPPYAPLNYSQIPFKNNLFENTKCESKHWYACGADGRLVGRSVGRSRDYQIFWDG